LGREEKGEGGDRGDLVEKKESPKGKQVPEQDIPCKFSSNTGMQP